MKKEKMDLQLYNAFDKELLDYYIKAPKVIACIFSAISIIFLLIAFCDLVFLYFFGIALIITLIFVFTYLSHTKKYGNKIAILEDELKIYSIHNVLLYSFKKDSCKQTNQIVLFDGPRASFIKKHCLIFYQDEDIGAEIEYRSYWNVKNVLIIQNPDLIVRLMK